MRVKRHFIIGILLAIVTLQTNIDCVQKGASSKTSRISSKIKGASFTVKKAINKGKAKITSNTLMKAFNMKGSTYSNWKTIIGFAPVLKENDVQKLLNLVQHDADLIKMGAFKKLVNLSKVAKTMEEKKELALAKIQAATELVKYYGTVNNCPKVKCVFGQGLYFSHTCVKLHGSNPGECLKRKAQLIEAFLFSHGLEMHRPMRSWISSVSKSAEKHLKDDKTLKFIDTRIACEIKLMQEHKNIFLKSLMKLYSGGTKKDKSYDCVKELLPFQSIIEEVGSFKGEYYYLLAKAYAHKGELTSALTCLEYARKSEVFDQKVQLQETSTKVASTEDAKKELVLAKIRAATELVKYYGVVNNCPKVKYSFGQGLYYSHTCVKLHGCNPGECLKRKVQLIESFVFSHGIEIHRGMRSWISSVSKAAADKYLKDDVTLKFIDTRITGEIKLMQEDKKIFLKSLMKLYADDGTKKDKSFDWVKELLEFETMI